MCGRYAAFLPAEAVARLFHTVNPVPNLPPSWNVAPSQEAMVVRRHPGTGARHLDLLKWGLVPHWTKDPAHAQRPINAEGGNRRDRRHVPRRVCPAALHRSSRRVL